MSNPEPREPRANPVSDLVLARALRVVVADGSATLEPANVAGQAIAVVAPRGIGPTAWPAAKDTQIRRRFYLLGETLDGQRVWDVRRALAVLRARPEFRNVPITLVGAGPMASVAL